MAVNWAKPIVGSDSGIWGSKLNTILDQFGTSINSDYSAGDQAPWQAWNYDPVMSADLSTTGTAITGGVVYTVRVPVGLITVTNIIAYVSIAGATLTAGQCFAGLYDSTGTRVGVSADQQVAWQSTGLKTMALTVPYVIPTPGTFYVALLANGTTKPAFLRSVSGTPVSAIVNMGMAAPFRFGTILTAQTSLPSSITLASVAADVNPHFVALS